MSKRKTVKEAADLLAILASQPESWPWFTNDAPGGWSVEARELAHHVRLFVMLVGTVRPWREDYAEAEAMLRNGEWP